MAIKKVGVLEYHDEKYIKEVMAIVKKNADVDISFLKLNNCNFSELGKYSVVYDMISPFNRYVAEYMKMHFLNGTYCINNPFTISTYHKFMQIYKLIEMKMPIPQTIVIPNYSEETDNGFVSKPDFKEILDRFKFPFIMKPYDGFANQNIFVIKSKKELYKTYEEHKDMILLVQDGIVPIDFYRLFIINKKNIVWLKRQPRFIEAKNYDFYDFSKLTPSLKRMIEKKSLEINKEMNYDLTTIEWSLTKEGKAYIIDVNDAPNIADPRKAKKMDLHFPQEVYNALVKHISDMILEKLEKDKHPKRFINSSNNFSVKR